jgi:hypothetical protein
MLHWPQVTDHNKANWKRAKPNSQTQEDYWGGVQSMIELDVDQFGPDALRVLDDFSHVEVLFHLSRVEDEFVYEARGIPEAIPTGHSLDSLRSAGRHDQIESLQPSVVSSKCVNSKSLWTLSQFWPNFCHTNAKYGSRHGRTSSW